MPSLVTSDYRLFLCPDMQTLTVVDVYIIIRYVLGTTTRRQYQNWITQISQQQRQTASGAAAAAASASAMSGRKKKGGGLSGKKRTAGESGSAMAHAQRAKKKYTLQAQQKEEKQKAAAKTKTGRPKGRPRKTDIAAAAVVAKPSAVVRETDKEKGFRESLNLLEDLSQKALLASPKEPPGAGCADVSLHVRRRSNALSTELEKALDLHIGKEPIV